MKTRYKVTKKDIVITIIFLLIVVMSIIGYICQHGYKNWGGVIEQTLLIMLSFVSLVDIASYANWSICVPDFFEFAKEKKHEQDVKTYMEVYIKEDANFLQDYNQERISFVMSQLGITRDQFDKIRLELIKMRCMPLKNLDDAREKLERLVTSDAPVIIDQKAIHASDVCYTKVDYYINIIDIMFMPDYASEISSILAFLIKEKTDDLSKIDKLVIPYDSNFLLGVEVGKKLGKSIVKMRHKKGRIEIHKIWDGDLGLTDRVIIIHDVLVSGDQIIDTINKIPDSCAIVGFFCLIARKEWGGKKRVMNKGIPCYEVMEINDDIIRRFREKV